MKHLFLFNIFIFCFLEISFAQEYTMPSFVHAIDACDMDMDGSNDIIVSCGYSDSIIILFNDGVGNFDLYYYDRITGSAICGCIDGDNFPDIIAGKGQMYYYKNNGDRTLGSGDSLMAFSGTFNLYGLIDMNDDGLNDLFYQIYGANSQWGFMQNNGNLTFTERIIYSGNSSKPSLGYLNFDNAPDILVSFPDPISKTKTYINNGNFNFSTSTVIDLVISDPIIIECNDSMPGDLALFETPTQNVYLFKNIGDTNYQFMGNNPLINVQAILLNDYNDYNQDGFGDVCCSQCYLTGCNDSIYVSNNTQGWSFEKGHPYYIGALNWFRMKSIDLNGDSYPDFYMTGYDSNNKIKILWNNGDGTFSYLNPVGIYESGFERKQLIRISPNPFGKTTKILFECSAISNVSLKIIDMRGVDIKNLITGQTKLKGTHQSIWDGTDNSGKKCNPGVYIISLKLNGRQYSQRVIYIRH
jgi:hypothetical protein